MPLADHVRCTFDAADISERYQISDSDYSQFINGTILEFSVYHMSSSYTPSTILQNGAIYTY